MIEWPGVALFAILFVWQFPHFMAIGWMYREEYARAGIRLTPNLPNTQYAALSTVVQALFYAAIMIPVSLWPVTLHVTGTLYAGAATILGLVYLWYTIRFARIVRNPESEASSLVARELLRASVIYLPLLLAAMMLDAKGRLFF
jgi:protoheme IX farnesyltransferase